MLTALLTFLGSAGLRLFIGKLFDAFDKWQDHRNELARLTLQGQLDAAQHERNQAAIRLQAEMGVKVIEAQTVAHVTSAEADAFVEAVKATGQRTGVAWVDVWNGVIRPLLATVCIVLWIRSLAGRGFVLDEWDRALMGLALGVFVGGRIQSTGR
jgi:hypothetical protein